MLFFALSFNTLILKVKYIWTSPTFNDDLSSSRSRRRTGRLIVDRVVEEDQDERLEALSAYALSAATLNKLPIEILSLILSQVAPFFYTPSLHQERVEVLRNCCLTTLCVLVLHDTEVFSWTTFVLPSLVELSLKDILLQSPAYITSLLDSQYVLNIKIESIPATQRD
ncbi:hypothetical protein JCM11641_007384 [Rhodosporidiobolus odoratus]